MDDPFAVAEDYVADAEAHQKLGYGDFERLLKLLRARGKRFMVMSTKRFIARELREVAGMHFVDFEDIRPEVQKVALSPLFFWVRSGYSQVVILRSISPSGGYGW